MAERNLLFNGHDIYAQLLDDLSRVMVHAYDIDEIFKQYAAWSTDGEGSVDAYCIPLFPILQSESAEEQEDARDNRVALRNAMINLYCALDASMPGLDKHTVLYASFHPDQDESLIVTVR